MNERSIFIDALDIDDPAERASYLDRACGVDVAVRGRVERLLKAHSRAGDFLQPPGLSAEPTDPPAETIGPVLEGQIGPYRLSHKLGEGGMGTVYLAEQTEPVRRQVALKVIKPGMDSAPIIARFEAERQALALMDHPNIAKVLDAGTVGSGRWAVGKEDPNSSLPTAHRPLPTVSGRPYFVMELVPGVSVTRFCDANRLTLRQRLELFVPVCQAVQHAHQKGVIHRDLKPSNVLVALYDGRPVPKVIDFGVAKALDQRLTEKTVVTGFGQMIGTLEYMAPEQARLDLFDTDTRADVYALGVLLYELLTGTTPFDRGRLRAAALDDVLRILREEEPPAPSTRVAAAADRDAVAARRGSDPGRLSGLLKGELDWIVMKALEKDRDRRYETAAGLAADVQRYLADEPVQACPPSGWYRVRKFARRNRAALATVAMVAAALLVGTALATWQAVVATRARYDAVAAAAAETKAKEAAEEREAEKRAVLDFVQNKILAAARPKGQVGGLGRDVSLRKAIEEAVPFVDKSFANEPLIEAQLRMTLGESFRYLGEAGKAAEQFQMARTLFTRHLGRDHLETHKSQSSLAVMYDALGRHPDALPLRLETIAVRKAQLGPDHPDTIASMINLANSYAALSRHPEALTLREETLTLAITVFGRDHPDTLLCMSNLANTFDTLDQHADALRLREETLAGRRAHPDLGPDHPDTLLSMNNLAVSYNGAARHEDALRLRQEALALRHVRLGPDHPDTLNSMHNVAFSYAALGQHDDALRLREETLALRKAHPDLGPNHPDTLRSMHALALSYTALDRHDEAIQLHFDTLARRKARFGPDHSETHTSIDNLAEAFIAAQRWAEAEPVVRECLAIHDRKRPDAWRRFHVQSLLGAALLGQRKYAEAERLLVQGCEGLRRRVDRIQPNNRVFLVEALERVVRLFEETDRPRDAAEWRLRLDAVKAGSTPPGAP